MEWSHLKHKFFFAVNDIPFVSLRVRGGHTRKLDESVLGSGETHKMQGNHLTTDWERYAPGILFFETEKIKMVYG